MAYDVYERRTGRGPRNWLEHSSVMIVATGLFWPIVFAFYWQMSRADPKCHAEGWRGHLRMLNFNFGRPGYLRRMIPEWLSYFKYSFHPGSRTMPTC
ncbi:metal-dependent hydrolase [Salinisphaera sp. SWV1]|uniref:metal-dependent hydrolase n=1 Tax=Salinisphaera sp. SWV1 TaxID=3454139 RepID=UPI003F850E25